MQKIKVTEFRNHLPEYLARSSAGETLEITSRGRIVARLVPPGDVKAAARRKLEELRGKCKIGDVLSPIDERWDATDDRS